MNRARLRSRLLTAASVILVAFAWWYLAPTSIGGSTRYVVTTGISMEPRLHRGDLAIVRTEDNYRVGQIVAYHSTLLGVTVLHRIIGRDGNRYVFKGDNNNFIDPTRPTRAELLGALWLQVPRGGAMLKLVHSPIAAAILCGALGLLLVFGAREERRRQRRRARGGGGAGSRGRPPMRTDQDGGRSLNWSALLAASAVAGAVFVLIGLFAFTRPAQRPRVANTPYVQHMTFGYHARARASAVYPTGTVSTGDPIFSELVHRLDVHIEYRLTSPGQHAVSGAQEVVLQLTGPGGWARTMVLIPRTRFHGDHTSTDVMLDLPHLQSLFQQVTRLTGSVAGSVYTVAVQPRVHLTGRLAAESLDTRYTPSLTFQLGPTQLVPASAASASPPGTLGGTSGAGGSQSGFAQQQAGAVGTPIAVPNTLSIRGVGIPIEALRWISLLGLVLSAMSGLFVYLRKRSEPFEETFRIQAQYGHLIVPIVAGEDLGWPPVDVPSIKALARLAESGQRLILHNRSNDVDTYLVNDEGTVYRYQVRPSKVIWGEWSEAGTPVKAAA